MLAVPAVIPVTTPEGSTDALASAVHVPPASPDAISIMDAVGQTVVAPTIMPAAAGVLIVVANVLIDVPQLLLRE